VRDALGLPARTNGGTLPVVRLRAEPRIQRLVRLGALSIAAHLIQSNTVGCGTPQRRDAYKSAAVADGLAQGITLTAGALAAGELTGQAGSSTRTFQPPPIHWRPDYIRCAVVVRESPPLPRYGAMLGLATSGRARFVTFTWTFRRL
jgi:hypothetical protein